MTRRIQRLLIANRGEIACRIARTCQRLGIEAIGVHSEADEASMHVREVDRSFGLGPAPAERSYLRIEALLDAAARAQADAVHPGYGFLAESPALAEAVQQAGMLWVGPPPAAIRAMGDKMAARRLAREHGIATLVGYDGEAGESDEALVAAAEQVGFPLLVKAAAGGGGRGIRLVRQLEDLPVALAEARQEAQSAFGDGRLLLERYLERARHIEVQVLADSEGDVVQLFERDCSIQRRRQKVVEEAPSPAVDAHLRAHLGEAAVRVAQLVDYRGAGTVEFLLDGAGDFYFLEMNTRLQVEHPVTEAITGLDLVELQIRIAEGHALQLDRLAGVPQGHAIEVRVYAEDPMRDFAPASGEILAWDIPLAEGIRVDAGYQAGDRVGVHYDALLAKVIAHGADRAEAGRRLESALRGAWIAGVTTNLPLLRQIVSHEQWHAGSFDTGFMARCGLPRSPPVDAEAGALAAVALDWLLRVSGPVALAQGWRCWGSAPLEACWQGLGTALRTSSVELANGHLAVAVDPADSADPADPAEQKTGPRRYFELRPLGLDDGVLRLVLDGHRVRWRVALQRAHGGRSVGALEGNDVVYVHTGTTQAMLRLEPSLEGGDATALASGTCLAPMPGTIVQLHVAVDQQVEVGAPLVTLEAMKMQQTLSASQAGRVSEVLVERGDAVDEGAVLVTLEGA